MAPASKEGVTVADKEYLLGNKARELLKYTNQATKTVAEDISRKDVRQIFQKIAALDDIRDVQKVCSESIAISRPNAPGGLHKGALSLLRRRYASDCQEHRSGHSRGQRKDVPD